MLFYNYLFTCLMHVSPPDGEFHKDRHKTYYIYCYIVTTWFFVSGSKKCLLNE